MKMFFFLFFCFSFSIFFEILGVYWIIMFICLGINLLKFKVIFMICCYFKKLDE